jgi:DUF4097 and DUF4098 domain-containing protein YvlB
MTSTTAPDSARTFPVTGPLAVSIELGAGDVSVTASDVTEATVSLTPAQAGDPDALDLIARSQVDLRGTALRIDVPQRVGFRRNAEIRIEATVPTSSTLSVKTGSADIHGDGTFGDIKLNTGSGDVWVDTAATGKAWTADRVRVGVATDASIKTGSGDITVGRSDGELSVTTGSGDIRVDELGGEAELKTASGEIDVSSSAGEVEAKTASGDIAIRGAAEGVVQVKSASGDVTVGVAQGTATLLDCSSVTGRVRSALEPSDAPAESEERRLIVKARSVSGNITINRA